MHIDVLYALHVPITVSTKMVQNKACITKARQIDLPTSSLALFSNSLTYPSIHLSAHLGHEQQQQHIPKTKHIIPFNSPCPTSHPIHSSEKKSKASDKRRKEMRGLLYRGLLTLINIFFPPIAVAMLAGAEWDCMLNCIFFLCGVLPSLACAWVLYQLCLLSSEGEGMFSHFSSPSMHACMHACARFFSSSVSFAVSFGVPFVSFSLLFPLLASCTHLFSYTSSVGSTPLVFAKVFSIELAARRKRWQGTRACRCPC